MDKRLTLLLLLLPIFSTPLQAQDFKRFNELDMQPEVWHFAGPQEAKVDAKGDLNLSIPIMTVPGTPGRDFEIAFSYKAGIRYHQQASWIGLGWNFDPGSITRDVQGNIRVTDAAHGVYDYEFGPDYEDDGSSPKSWQYMPDTYYLTLPGKGTVPFGRANSSFHPDFHRKHPNRLFESNAPFYFEDYRPWRIEGTPLLSELGVAGMEENNITFPNGKHDVHRFIITTEDGVRYFFGLPSIGLYKSYVPQSQFSDPQHSAYVNVWRLLAIAGPDYAGDDNLLLRNVRRHDRDYESLRNYVDWIVFEYRNDPGGGPDNVFQYWWQPGESQIIHNTYLKRIITPTHFAEFVHSSRSDGDLQHFKTKDDGEFDVRPYYKKLASIVLYRYTKLPKIGSAGTSEVKEAVLDQDYSLARFRRFPEDNAGMGKLTLNRIYFRSHDGQNLPSYDFQYVSLNPDWTDLSDRWYIDGYGYYDDGHNGTLKIGIDDVVDDAQAWSLEQITFPAGATERYEYENDRIDNSYTYYYDDSGEEVKYYFTNGRRQGGIRVTKIVRTEPLKDENMRIDFTYGEGWAPCVPPQLVPWLTHQQGDPVPINFNEYRAMNRGGNDIVYESIRWSYDFETLPAHEVYYYDVNKNFFTDTQARPQGCFITNLDNANIWRFYTDNRNFSWTRLIKKETIFESGGKKTVTYRYDDFATRASRLHTVIDAQTGFIWQYCSQVKSDTTVWDYQPFLPGTPKSTVAVSRTLSPATKQVKSILTVSSDRELREDITYAFEKDEYSDMLQSNLLAPVCERRTYFKDQTSLRDDPASPPTFVLQSASVTTFRELPPWPPQVDAPLGDGEPFFDLPRDVWQVHRQYAWRSDDHASPADFDGWDGSAPSDSRWQLQFEALQYKYGQITRYKDAYGHEIRLYYGDNANPADTTETMNGPGRAYITAIEAFEALASGASKRLSRRFQYDSRFAQVSEIADENGRKTTFQYDNFGRLSGSSDEKGSIANYDYAFSRPWNGAFDPETPNYVKTRSFYDENEFTDIYDYYDSRARRVQTVIDTLPGVLGAGEYHLYSGAGYNMYDQTIQEFKPLEQPATASTPAYNPSVFDNALLTFTNYFSKIDDRPTAVYHPGFDVHKAELEHSVSKYTYKNVLAKTILPEFYDTGGGLPPPQPERKSRFHRHGLAISSSEAATIVWQQVQQIDENDNEVFTYQDESGKTVFKLQYVDSDPGNVLQTHFHYDGAGNLLLVHPPNYFEPPHGAENDWVTSYQYNTLNQLIRKETPDDGVTEYFYDKNGNLRFVKDGNGAANGYFIYYKYDFLNRKIEEGRVETPALFTQANADDPDFPTSGQIVDVEYTFDMATQPGQRHVKGRLARVVYRSEHFSNSGVEYYSYDARGNVEWVEKEIAKNDASSGNYPFRIEYSYDLQNNITKLEYSYAQPSDVDALYVWYDYDALGRLTAVYSNGVNIKPGDPDALYTYEPTGQVKRLELGGGIQGVDHIYNERDWLTQINHPDLTLSSDPGQDGGVGLLYYYKMTAVQGGIESDFSETVSQQHTGGAAALPGKNYRR